VEEEALPVGVAACCCRRRRVAKLRLSDQWQ
jgi:hypothetical protein